MAVNQPPAELPDDLWTQSTARRYARDLNEAGEYVDGSTNVAHAVPLHSWGGREKGWTVSLVPLQS